MRYLSVRLAAVEPTYRVIISHQHQFIFFAVPKTGTHSIRQALRPHLGADDEEQVRLFEQHSFSNPELKAVGHGHLSVAQVKPVLGEDIFEGYFKFAFVRNPWDRFVSFCAFISRATGQFEQNPHGFMVQMIHSPPPLQQMLYQPQSALLIDADGRLAMDFVGHVETMERDYKSICERLKLQSEPLQQVNRSRHRPYVDYYTPQLRDLIATRYRQDIEMFGYRFDD